MGPAPVAAPDLVPGFAPGVAPVPGAVAVPGSCRRPWRCSRPCSRPSSYRRRPRSLPGAKRGEYKPSGYDAGVWLQVGDVMILGVNSGGTLVALYGHVSARCKFP